MTQYEIKEIPASMKNTTINVAKGTRKLVSVHTTKAVDNATLKMYAGETEPVITAGTDRFELTGNTDGVYTIERKAGSNVHTVRVVHTNSFSVAINSAKTIITINMTSSTTMTILRSAMNVIRISSTPISENFVVKNNAVGTISGTAGDVIPAGNYTVIEGQAATPVELTMYGTPVFSILDIHKRFADGMWVRPSDHDAAYLLVYS